MLMPYALFVAFWTMVALNPPVYIMLPMTVLIVLGMMASDD
jgi:hypothetical protein